MEQFAVVDTETTGFGKTDRILEIGIVLVDGNEIVEEWETLINPERDISNSNIHGITSDAVSLAPVFSEIVDEISTFLNNRIFVAHNISFDVRMLEQEFSRLGRLVDFGRGFCTLQATRMKLEAACLRYGVNNASAHRALTDARATALILSQISRNSSTLAPVNIRNFNKGAITRTLARSAMDSSHSSRQQNFRRIARNFEIMGIDGAQLSYMDALSSVMSDFEITKDEARDLKEWAVDLGLSQEQQRTAHEQFLPTIMDAANRDGFLSETELDLIAKAAAALDVTAPSRPVQKALVNHLEVGTRVCFTGEARDADGLEIPREVLEAKAVVKGLIPVSGVTKKACELLVAADKSSMSGKTRKARDFGIPVISVEEFLKLI